MYGEGRENSPSSSGSLLLLIFNSASPFLSIFKNFFKTVKKLVKNSYFILPILFHSTVVAEGL